MRGTSLEEIGPGDSAKTSTCSRPPTFGRKARVNSSTPMPPTQQEKDRHSSSPRGRPSTPLRIEAPVVVRPETVSNRQSTYPPNRPENQKGSAPHRLRTIQISPTTAKPSRA